MAMPGMMKTAVAVSNKTVANFDDVIALARMISNPKALDGLRAEFADHAKNIQEATEAHEKAAADAEALLDAADKRDKALAAQEAALAKKQADHAANVENLEQARAAHVGAVQKLAIDTKMAKADVAKTLKDGQTKLDVASQALDARAKNLAEREKAVATAEAGINALNAAATASQKKADALATKYTKMIERLKSATAEVA